MTCGQEVWTSYKFRDSWRTGQVLYELDSRCLIFINRNHGDLFGGSWLSAHWCFWEMNLTALRGMLQIEGTGRPGWQSAGLHRNRKGTVFANALCMTAVCLVFCITYRIHYTPNFL